MHREGVNILSNKPQILANYLPTGCAIQENSVVIELRKLMEAVSKKKESILIYLYIRNLLIN
jgi:hypothetical protein